MLTKFALAFVVLASAAVSGCLHQAIAKPEYLTAKHDQVNTFVASRSFDDVHAFVTRAAMKCYARVSSGGIAPAGKNIYIPVGGGIRREIDDRLIEPGNLAMVAVVVRGGPPPLGPEDYILRADLRALGPAATEVTTYNAMPARAQRAFHEQVRRWVVDQVEDCSGSGPFD